MFSQVFASKRGYLSAHKLSNQSAESLNKIQKQIGIITTIVVIFKN